MIFADKLIKLRRRKGWSQEELAEKMNVTRQSVSKWESTQSLPDLDRILQLSELFGVSTDYLLKDEVEEAESEAAEEENARYVSAQDTENFLAAKKATAMPVSIGVLLCINSPICLLLLGALSERNQSSISENLAGGLGIIILLLFIAAAVALFIFSGSKTSAYEYMEKEALNVDSNIIRKIRSAKEEFSKTYVSRCAAGVIICILGIIPLFAGIIINEDNDVIVTAALCITLFAVSLGVMLLTRVNIINNAYNMLLQEGDYSKDKKQKNPLVSAVTVSYWLAATAIFLICSFLTNKWNLTWIVFAAAGVLFPAVLAVTDSISRKK